MKWELEWGPVSFYRGNWLCPTWSSHYTAHSLLVPVTELSTAGIDCKINMVYKAEESVRRPRRRHVLSWEYQSILFGLTEVKLCNALVAKAHNNPNVILAKSEPNSTSLKVCYFQAKFSLLFFSFFFLKNIMWVCLNQNILIGLFMLHLIK